MEIRFSIKNLLTIILAGFILYIIYSAITTIIIIIFGFLVAYMLSPLAYKLSRKRIPYPVAAVIVLLILFVLLGFIMLWLAPQLYHDVERIVRQTPRYVTVLMGYVEEIGNFFDVDLSSSALYSVAANKLSESATTIVKWLTSLLGSVQSTVTRTLSIVMIPAIACVVLVSYPTIQKFLDKYTGRSRKYISLSSEVLSSYFRGQFTVMAILCVLYSIALSIVGLDAAILLGVLTGLLSLVPYLGFAVGIVLSVLFALIQFQDLWHPFYVILGYSVVQVIESFGITPKIVGDSVGLHPAATIIVLLISGSVFGLVGMILALPIVAIVFRIYKEKLDSKLAQAAEPEE